MIFHTLAFEVGNCALQGSLLDTILAKYIECFCRLTQAVNPHFSKFCFSNRRAHQINEHLQQVANFTVGQLPRGQCNAQSRLFSQRQLGFINHAQIPPPRRALSVMGSFGASGKGSR